MRLSFFLLQLVTLLALTNTRARIGDEEGKDENTNNDPREEPSFCERINPDALPRECACQDNAAGPLSFAITCVKPFDSMYLNDTIGMKLTVAPCDPHGSSISLNITEEDHDIDWRISGIRAGETVNLPIPGLAVIVPGMGHLGLDAAVRFFGNPDQLTIKVGLNACVAVHSKQVCANSIPGVNKILPWWMISGTFSFGDICNTTATKPAGSVEATFAIK